MNPEPAKHLTEQLAEETVHGHALIHLRSVNPGLAMVLLGERRLLVTAGPLGAPRAWCVDVIVDELGSFILIGFSNGSLVWTIFVRAYR